VQNLVRRARSTPRPLGPATSESAAWLLLHVRCWRARCSPRSSRGRAAPLQVTAASAVLGIGLALLELPPSVTRKTARRSGCCGTAATPLLDDVGP
jgi:hypothetical protein